MNSKKATTDKMFREMVAKQIQAMGTRPEGVTLAVEHGTASLSREQLQAVVNRLHAERDPLVVKARSLRMQHGVGSPEFAAAWFDVERVTRDLGEAEADLKRAGAKKRKLRQVYLRWHLDLADGGSMESSGLPYFAKVNGAKVSMVADDLAYLENERKALTANGRQGSVHLRMMELPDTGAGYKTVNLIEELEAEENAKTKLAAESAMDLIAQISRMPEAEAVKVVNVIEAGLKVLAHGQALKKAVPNG